MVFRIFSGRSSRKYNSLIVDMREYCYSKFGNLSYEILSFEEGLTPGPRIKPLLKGDTLSSTYQEYLPLNLMSASHDVFDQIFNT